jgi:hypothetical protein
MYNTFVIQNIFKKIKKKIYRAALILGQHQIWVTVLFFSSNYSDWLKKLHSVSQKNCLIQSFKMICIELDEVMNLAHLKLGNQYCSINKNLYITKTNQKLINDQKVWTTCIPYFKIFVKS